MASGIYDHEKGNNYPGASWGLFGEIQAKIIELHNVHKSWRYLADNLYPGINYATLSTIARGHEPKKPATRLLLGLPLAIGVYSIDGPIVPGSQSIGSRQCPCGRHFIPNHGLRKWCFICRPKRKQG